MAVKSITWEPEGTALFMAEHIEPATFHIVDGFVDRRVDALPVGASAQVDINQQAKAFSINVTTDDHSPLMAGRLMEWNGVTQASVRAAGLRWGAGGPG